MALKYWAIFLGFVILIACEDYHRQAHHWVNNIERGTNIQKVKNDQPDFIKIDWDKPNAVGDSIYYEMTKIKGEEARPLVLLVFYHGKYQRHLQGVRI